MKQQILMMLALASATLVGAAPAPQFAVASVKPNTFGNSGVEGSDIEKITVSPTSVSMLNVTLRSCLRWAYGLRDPQLAGPSWMATQRYDISAATSAAASAAEMKQMMQTLLGDRFRLQLHREAKLLAAYEMTADPKKRSLFKAAADEAVKPSMLPVGGTLEFRNYGMADLAERLAERPFKLDRQVVDRTGIEGRFDLTMKLADSENSLKHTLEGMEQGSDHTPSMLTLLHEQLGLGFKAVKTPLESLVIDHAEKVPTAN